MADGTALDSGLHGACRVDEVKHVNRVSLQATFLPDAPAAVQRVRKVLIPHPRTLEGLWK
jgi:hypothetical protein